MQDRPSHSPGEHGGPEIHPGSRNATAGSSGRSHIPSWQRLSPPCQDCGRLRTTGNTDSPWPARSLDLSPIEHLWDELGRCTYVRDSGIRTRHQLEQALCQEWQAIPQRTVRYVINSMRSRVIACIDTNGGHTRYWHLESNVSCSYPYDLKRSISRWLWKWLCAAIKNQKFHMFTLNVPY